MTESALGNYTQNKYTDRVIFMCDFLFDTCMKRYGTCSNC